MRRILRPLPPLGCTCLCTAARVTFGRGARQRGAGDGTDGLTDAALQDSTYTLNSFQVVMGFGKDGILNVPAASVKKGVCVECKTECDCDVNQYCGTHAHMHSSGARDHVGPGRE